MSWYSRTWAACSWRAGGVQCEEEVLRTKAEDRGWFEKPDGGWLCPRHRPDRAVYDVYRRAAGEREDD
jgi:hypothetical protein